jgi:hypothetical protein
VANRSGCFLLLVSVAYLVCKGAVYNLIKILTNKQLPYILNMQQRQATRNILSDLPQVWECLKDDYDFLKVQGQGSFGQVVKCT